MRRAKPFVPNERDREIIWLTYDYRYVSIDILHALLKEPPTEDQVYGFGVHAVRARCQKLREHGYLVWHHLRDEPTGRGHHSERPMVYSVGPAAAGVLEDATSMSPRQFKRVIERNVVGSMFLRHELGISRFRACLELACRNSNGLVRIGSWLQGGLTDRIRVVVDGIEQDAAIVPDAAFSLMWRDQTGQQRASHFFLEYDTGSMSLGRIAMKAVGYEHYLRRDLYKRRYTYAGTSAAEPQLRFVRKSWQELDLRHRSAVSAKAPATFQVLIVTRSPNGKAALGSEGGQPLRMRQTNMVVSVCNVQAESLSDTFLFCTEGVDYSVSQPSGLFGAMWQSTDSRGKRPMVKMLNQ